MDIYHKVVLVEDLTITMTVVVGTQDLLRLLLGC